MKYLRKFNESVDDKFSDDFINTIKDICLDLTDIYYKVEVRNSAYSLMSGSEQAFNTLRPGDKVIVDSLKIDVLTNSDEVGFDSDILRSTLERVKSFSSEFNFLVDVYVLGDDEFISVDDAISLCSDDARFTISDYNEITIIIY